MTTTQQHEYNPRNYTQDEINAGQRQINFALALADKALIEVLVILKEAIEAPPGKVRTYADDICKAIDQAAKAINHIMSIRPPGCDFTWTPPPDPELSWTRAERHAVIFSENEASQITRDSEENRKEIKELNEKLYKLTTIVQRLSDKIDAKH